MNYEANTENWGVGEIVVHDADAKEPRMLMCVIGKDAKTGELKTRYRLPSEHGVKVWVNDPKYLHDPKRFGLMCDWRNFNRLQLKAAQRQFEIMRIWNYWHKPGAIVQTTSADKGGEYIFSRPAYLSQSGRATLHIDLRGAWDLDFIKVIKEAEGGK